MPAPIRTPNAPLRPLALALALLAPAACSQIGQGTGASASATGESTSGGESESDGTTTATTGASASATGSTATTTTTTAGVTSDSESGDACGNGVIDPGEVCDGTELGGMTCVGLGDPYVGGTLGCSPLCVGYDASGCEVGGDAPMLRLNELLGKGADEGPYADQGDVIEIYNAGAAVAELGGFQLSDEPDFPADKTYVFAPGVTLAPGEWLVLVAYDDMTKMGDFPFGISTSNQETISLADGRGVVVDAVTVDGALTEVSYCRLPDGEGAWATCAQTPGEANKSAEDTPPGCGDGVVDPGESCDGDDLDGMTCQTVSNSFGGGVLACNDACGFDTSQCVPVVKVAINEVSSSDVDPIEIYNAGAAPVDLSGWILTDDTTDPYDPDADDEELVLPPGTILPAKGFLVINKGNGALDHPFGLSAGGDAVRLFDKDLGLIDDMTYGDGEAAVSECRIPDGPSGLWKSGCLATFGSANKAP
ncbi:MAG: lamin tail domain-containing protein [Nannocystaceae bacterium]